MIRRTRSDKGKKRIGSRIRSAVITAAKYGTGLYVGSKIYGAGAIVGTSLGNRTIGRLAPNARAGGALDRARNIAKGATTMVVADQTVKAVNRVGTKYKEKEEARKRN